MLTTYLKLEKRKRLVLAFKIEYIINNRYFADPYRIDEACHCSTQWLLSLKHKAPILGHKV